MYEMAGNIKESRKMKVRIYEKMTLPISCVVFSLIGSTLGIKQNIRSSKSQGFGLSIILIFITCLEQINRSKVYWEIYISSFGNFLLWRSKDLVFFYF